MHRFNLQLHKHCGLPWETKSFCSWWLNVCIVQFWRFFYSTRTVYNLFDFKDWLVAMSSLWKVSKTAKMLKCHDLIASERKYYIKHLPIVWMNNSSNFSHWWRKSHVSQWCTSVRKAFKSLVTVTCGESLMKSSSPYVHYALLWCIAEKKLWECHTCISIIVM